MPFQRRRFLLLVPYIVKLFAAKPARMRKFRPEWVAPRTGILAAAAVWIAAKPVGNLFLAVAIVNGNMRIPIAAAVGAATAAGWSDRRAAPASGRSQRGGFRSSFR